MPGIHSSRQPRFMSSLGCEGWSRDTCSGQRSDGNQGPGRRDKGLPGQEGSREGSLWSRAPVVHNCHIDK